MRIPLIPVSNQLNELAIIELQGQLISLEETFVNQKIGPLIFDGDHATLTIGNHLLHGKIHRLKAPLAVVERGSTEGIPIIAVIRQKVVFSERSTILFPE
ncbi:chromosome transmission fidelity protein 8 [Histomonas meleagridis]|uniref:chromosome transmission fidelity protein 8-like n=1 Tax=Histomonas meleagridis TaxID=135588 RepID=UPI00355AC850|nr:chromosome transmission fidelity protein 8 [Histomonas meleagridis]KAH0798188.1 chromosome transmission fidelity protein 8-like [Histomonas meleagridis]